MGVRKLLILCVPTFLVSLVYDFVPWGIVTATVSLVLYAAVLFFPSKSLVRVNAGLALEWLARGEISNAQDHIEIALREAGGGAKFSVTDIELLREACDKMASALIDAGQATAGRSLVTRAHTIISHLSQGVAI